MVYDKDYFDRFDLQVELLERLQEEVGEAIKRAKEKRKELLKQQLDGDKGGGG